MRVMITGSRDWGDYRRILQAITGYPEGTVFVHGGAKGADRMAGQAATQLGYDVEVFPADWKGKGKAAGVMRNSQMLDTKPDRVLAFHRNNSRGTAHAIREAEKRGIPVVRY